ncbi:hypothetical protein HZA42_04585 [Candidatus Peregrinibacteria bacterium]|nr:hypothetical protein [Candidatus Peregrinibacteria bacterium]
MKKLSLFFVATLVLAGCVQQTPQITTPTPIPTQPTTSQNAESFKSVPGQKFGDMVFAKVESNYATFTGTAEVTGQYSTSDLTGNICFYPDQNSAGKIPNLRGVGSQVYFCFSNGDIAKKLLGSSEGKATVTIQGYKDMTIATSQEPLSELVKVVSKN